MAKTDMGLAVAWGARLDTISTYINRCKAGGKSEEVIVSELEQYFDYSGAEARELYAKYAG